MGRMRRSPWLLLLCLPCVTVLTAPVGAEMPAWTDAWEFGAGANEEDGPNFFLDLLVPLIPFAPVDAPDQLLFLEPRLNYQNSEWLANLGLGYRHVLPGDTWLVGGNMFYDHQSLHAHYRLGWGLEALSRFAELRSNYYLGLSQERLVEETLTTATFEKAVDGFDVEAGMPVPYYSRLKLFGGYNWYNYERFKNRYGWTLRAEFTPVPYLVIDGLVGNDTKSETEWGVQLAVRIPFGRAGREDLRSIVSLDDHMFPDSDAHDLLYRLVERKHEIVVERRQQTGAVSVEVARGT